MANEILYDVNEWKWRLEINAFWTDFIVYKDNQNILPYFDGFMPFSASRSNGILIQATTQCFETYEDLKQFVKQKRSEVSKMYLNCILQNKNKQEFCIKYATVI